MRGLEKVGLLCPLCHPTEAGAGQCRRVTRAWGRARAEGVRERGHGIQPSAVPERLGPTVSQAFSSLSRVLHGDWPLGCGTQLRTGTPTVCPLGTRRWEGPRCLVSRAGPAPARTAARAHRAACTTDARPWVTRCWVYAKKLKHSTRVEPRGVCSLCALTSGQHELFPASQSCPVGRHGQQEPSSREKQVYSLCSQVQCDPQLKGRAGPWPLS